MNTSKIKTVIGTLMAMLAAVGAKVDLLSAVLPPRYATWLLVAVGVGGAILAAANQSLNPNHASIPVEQANALVANAPKAAEAYAPSLVKQVGGNAGQ